MVLRHQELGLVHVTLLAWAISTARRPFDYIPYRGIVCVSFMRGTRPLGAFGLTKGLLMNTNPNTRTLEIKGMTGDACVQKVTGALKGVRGVFTKSVNVGTATIGADQSACDAACVAIGTAGFSAQEGHTNAGTHTPAVGMPAASTQKPDGANPAHHVKPAGEKLSEGPGGGAPANPTGTSR